MGPSEAPATPELRCPDCDPVTVKRPLRYGSRLVLCSAHRLPERLRVGTPSQRDPATGGSGG